MPVHPKLRSSRPFVAAALFVVLILAGSSTALAGTATRAADSGLRVTLGDTLHTVTLGGSVSVGGRVSDPRGGITVQLLLRNGQGPWSTVATTTTAGDGSFTFEPRRAKTLGSFFYRAVVPASGNVPSSSSDLGSLYVLPKHPPLRVRGYVQAGGPIAGATVRIYLPGRQTPTQTLKTTPYGFFLTDLPRSTKGIEVVATGGTGPTGRFAGSMKARITRAGLARGFHVNPVTTLEDGYLATHPHATAATVDTKVRGLLGLESTDNLDRALGIRAKYFDGVTFLRVAAKHGGFDRYIATLVKRMDATYRFPVTFRRPASAALESPLTGFPASPTSAVAGLIGETAAGYLGTAAQAASVVSAGLGIMNLVGQLAGWSPGGVTPQDLLSAIGQVQSTLGTINQNISDLSSDVNTDYTKLAIKVDQTGYAGAVTNLTSAYNAIATTEADYTDMVGAEQMVADPTKYKPAQVTAAGNDLATYQSNYAASITDPQTGLQSYLGLHTSGVPGADTFYDVLLPDPTTDSKPALAWLVDQELDNNDQLYAAKDSQAVADFAGTVLSQQSLAFYLVLMYQQKLNVNAGVAPPLAGGVLDDLATAYLGSGYTSWPTYSGAVKATPPLPPTAAPDTGNLHDEMLYLQNILPVPPGVTVDATNSGLMYLDSNTTFDIASYFNGTGTACGDVDAFNTGWRDKPAPYGTAPADSQNAWICTAVFWPLWNLDNDLGNWGPPQGTATATAIETANPALSYATGLSAGWSLVGQATLPAVVARLQTTNTYYLAGPVFYGFDTYYVQFNGDNPAYTYCPDPSGYCTDSNNWQNLSAIDYLLFLTYAGSGLTTASNTPPKVEPQTICDLASGESTSKNACGAYSMLLERTVATGEVYIPQQ